MCLNTLYLVRYKTYSLDKVRFTLIKGKTHTFDWLMEKQGFFINIVAKHKREGDFGIATYT